MQIGSHKIETPLILAPMAGVTDRPFRVLCRRLGAGLAVSEMVSADAALRNNAKTLRRLDHDGEPGPVSVQIVGAEPRTMAAAAAYNAGHGAQIIDINMGCPAKKVCHKAAGSALLRNEPLVADILTAVVAAVAVPVTLKIRTGWDPDNRNGVAVARLAERVGIAALSVHGRTRACGYRGHAEYDTIARIKEAVSIPVVANGDIDSPAKAVEVLRRTGADALMIGRAAQGNPWIFREIRHFLATGDYLPRPPIEEIRDTLLEHLEELYRFYGEYTGVRVARKHLAWYSKTHPDGAEFRRRANVMDEPDTQRQITRQFFDRLMDRDALAA